MTKGRRICGTMKPKELLDFWFSNDARGYWFRPTLDFDQEITARFAEIWGDARQGLRPDWQQSAEGTLALVILLDQFPRNMFRGQPDSFSTGAAALLIAERAINRGLDARLFNEQKVFLYLPYMHSELIAHQERSVSLFEQANLTGNLKWAKHHRDIVQITFRSRRGPSNSQKKMFCQVDSPSFPFTMGTVSDGPTRPAFRWASPLPS